VLRVDAAAGVVTDDHRTWSLDLDCRTGGATVVVGDVAYRVAPLRWREKQRLARWAHLGAEFVTRQLVQLAVDEDVRPPDEGSEAVVAAVAAWVNGETPGLPLESGLLTHVTVDVCRGTGLAPVDLDDRDAIEVEAMWSALDEPASPLSRMHAATPRTPFMPFTGHRGRDEWADATQIVFVPDEATVDEHLPAEQDAHETPVLAPIAQGPQPDQPPPDPTPVEPPPAPPPEPPSATTSPRVATAPHRRRTAPRFRVLPAAELASPMTLVAPTGDFAPSAHTEMCALTGQNRGIGGAIYDHASNRTGSEPLRSAADPFVLGAPSGVNDAATASIDPRDEAPVDVEELAETVLDVIADEVEHAAEALGIEV
jgi:hypothetical protein